MRCANVKIFILIERLPFLYELTFRHVKIATQYRYAKITLKHRHVLNK